MPLLPLLRGILNSAQIQKKYPPYIAIYFWILGWQLQTYVRRPIQFPDKSLPLLQIVGGAIDDGAGEDAYEEKMKDALDLASEKATATRTKGLEALCSGLLKRQALGKPKYGYRL